MSPGLADMAKAYYECAGLYGAPSVVMTSCDTIMPVAITWLWPGWLPAGKFCLLAGAPGCGKTTLALDLMAAITNAGRWPDGSECTLPGNCVIWSGEDAPEDTLVPRLLAAGADLSRIHIVQGVAEDGRVRAFDPATDTDALADAVQSIGHVRLVLVDPVSVAVAGDSHRNSETRRGLQPLVDLASNTGACLLGISHLSKTNNGGDPRRPGVGKRGIHRRGQGGAAGIQDQQ
jgi:putative DNA primase/helicase